MRKFIFSFVCLLCFSVRILADYHDIQINRLDRSDGLSNSNVLSIEQDSFGFIWIATESGLNRFDGKSFVSYKHNRLQPHSLACNAINKLLIDDEGHLWIATTHEGLDRYNHETDDFTHYFPTGEEGDISGPAITDLSLSHNGNIWVATYYNGLNLFDKKQNKFVHYDVDENNPNSIREDIILKVYEDKQKQLWVGYRTKGLSVFDFGANKATHFIHDPSDPHSLPSNVVLAILQDRYDNIWVGTEKGLSLYNRSTKSFINFSHDPKNPKSLISDKVMAIYEMADGKIWVGTENGGISILDISFPILNQDKIEFQNIYSGDSKEMLNHNSVYSLFQDCYGNVWVGTFGGGINFISKYPDFFSKLEYIPYSNHKHSLNYRIPWGICEAPDGKIWIGTDGGGINVLNTVTGEVEVIKASPQTIGDNAVLCALTDSRGRMWFGTYRGGVSYYDSSSGKFKQFIHHPKDSSSLPSMDVRTVFEDRNGRILIGTMDGLCLFNPTTETFHTYTAKDGLVGNNCRTIAEDKNGNYWIGHHGGATLLNKDLSVKERFYSDRDNEKSLLSENVYTIYKDKKDRIWLGTENGLSYRDEQKNAFIHYTTNEGLEDNAVRAITEDENGFLWLSTNSGISRFDPSSGHFNNYNYKDGVPLGEFMDNSCLRSRSGLIYFGSRNGLCYFSPNHLLERIEAPSVSFTRFDLFNEPLLPDMKGTLKKNIVYADKVKLDHNQNVFSIHYSVTNFALQKKTVFRYKMEGMDTQWIEDREHGFASYKNIPPGRYTFKVEASVDNQDWSEKAAVLDIEILPPVWLRWWMKLLYLLLSLTLIVYLYRVYRNRTVLKRNLLIEKLHLKEVEELNKEKLQFFTNISHDIKTPLTLIISPIEDLLKIELTPEINKKLNLVYHNANLLLKLFNRLLDFRKIENGHSKLYLTRGNIISTVQDVCVSYKELKQNDSIKFVYSSEVDKRVIWYDREKVFSIVDNLISNAFKYTTEGLISVSVRETKKAEKEYVEIEVKDTGIGLTEKERECIYDRFYQVKNMSVATGTGIGLSLVKNFVALHQGEIYLDSTKGVGSCFRITISCSLSPDMGDPDLTDNPSEMEEELLEEAPVDRLTEELMMNKKILLVVDDNKDIREYVQSCFENEFRVLSADNGMAALAIIQQELPDIVISDVMMEGMDGNELCRSVKNNEATSHIPVILLTARTSMSDKQEGYDAGADSYVTKPFSSELLVTRVHNILQTRQKMTDYISKSFFNAQSPEQQERADAVKQNKLIKELIQLVEENMADERVDIEFLSSQLCLSHSSLFRKVKALTGLSINEFVRGIRMQKAKEFLLSGDYSVSEVAFKVGINSMRYFRQCFKEHYGVTPTDFIKNNLSS
ncbi:hybrid sensor histidine kinase/response regulator transcription factor [Bacteroides sp.]